MAATLALGLDARVVVLRALFGAAVVRNKDAEKKRRHGSPRAVSDVAIYTTRMATKRAQSDTSRPL